MSRLISKIVFEVNRFLSLKFFPDFKFHPETILLETTKSIGVGNGHALSRDLHLLAPLLLFLRVLKCRSLLDLGSGDGYVLRVAEVIGFEKVIGIEGDQSLHELAVNNLGNSTLYNLYFDDFNIRVLPENVDVVYFFNPAEYGTMIRILTRLRPRLSRFLVTKNFPISAVDIEKLGLRILWKVGSYRLYLAKGSTFNEK